MTKPSAVFSYIWQYEIDPARRQEFLDAYKPGGDWTRLFARHPGWLGTRLLQDVNDPGRFVTVDVWQSKQDRDAFREQNASDFDALDDACEAFTVKETFLGDFAEVGEDES